MNKPNDMLVSRELLERVGKADASMGASALQLMDGWVAMGELRALLAQPADQQGEPVACTSCDGSGEYIDALGDWRGYCSCPPGVELKEKHAQTATAKVVLPGLSDMREQYESWADANGYDVTRNEHGDYAGIVEDSMWSGWQGRAKLNGSQS